MEQEEIEKAVAVNLKEFASRVRKRMAQLDMTSACLARELGVSNSTVSQWVNGQNLPAKNKMSKIFDILKCDGYWLLYGAGTEPKNIDRTLTKKEFDIFDTSGRIQHLMFVNNIKAARIAKELDVSRTTVSQWVNGIARPRGLNLVNICDLLNCSPEWLLSGKTWPPTDNHDFFETTESIDENQEGASVLNVDIVDLESTLLEFSRDPIKAKRFLDNQKPKRTLKFSKSTLDNINLEPADLICFKLINVESLLPLFPENTTVGININERQVVDNKIYAFMHYDQFRIGRLHNMPNGSIRIRHENTKDYPDEIVEKEDKSSVVIIGRLFWYSVIL